MSYLECPKCGFGAPYAKHSSEKDMLMCRCPQCEYQWEKKPLDQLTPEDQSEAEPLSALEPISPLDLPSSNMGLITSLIIAFMLIGGGVGLFFTMQ